MALAETEQLTRMVASAALSRAICTIGELGVSDHIKAGSPESIQTLARRTGAHERSLYRLLRFTASYGVFRETGDRHFDHTPLSAALGTDATGSFRPATRMFHRMFKGWDGLDHSIRTGEAGAVKVFGEPMFDYIGRNPELGPIFDAGMTAFHGHETQAMLDAYDFGEIRTLADIGGGNGLLLVALLRRYPQLHGVLFDLGHVVGRARSGLAAAGLEQHVVAVIGTSTDVSRLWRTPLGLLFIDGGHSEANVVADYEGWAPWVASRGALVFHDIYPDPADGGQAPYRVYLRALASGAFTEVSVTGSLRVLERTGDGL